MGRGRGHSGERARGRDRGGVQPVRPERAPRGRCDFFWSTGACRRGFDCTFQHEQDPGRGNLASAENVKPEEEHDFFSMEGLTIASGGNAASTDYTLRPSEVHNHLKELLRANTGPNGAGFRNAFVAQGFVRVLASVNKLNGHWVLVPQRLLDFVVNGDALILVGDILRWTSVTCERTTSTRLSFQEGYFPLIQFFACELIHKTAIVQNVNKLYTVVQGNYQPVHEIISACMTEMINANSWGPSPQSGGGLTGLIVFETLAGFYYQLVTRFKSVLRDHPVIANLTKNLVDWFERWRTGINAGSFVDRLSSSDSGTRAAALNHMSKNVYRLHDIVCRETDSINERRRPAKLSGISNLQKQDALATLLGQSYSGPGEIREGGPRHDNDFASIADIRIAPTQQELTCPLEPYLPPFVPGVPHHLPAGSMQKHLDIQFRLLREELISTTRQSVNRVLSDIDDLQAAGQGRVNNRHVVSVLANLLKLKGGSYQSSGVDSVFFHLYTNVQFGVSKAERRNLTVGLEVDSPPGIAREPNVQKRTDYWKHSRRLSSGSMVALIVSDHGTHRVFLGTILSNGEEIGESAKSTPNRIVVRVSFFDAEIELRALRNDTLHDPSRHKYAFLIDNTVLFESVRPFLETLQTVEPTTIPFANYIAQEGSLEGVVMPPPQYSCAPGFRFDLSCLMKAGMGLHRLNTQDPGSIAQVRQDLIAGSILDHSQAHSVVDALSRGISLIQGPPGTGKSFTGKELLRVLFQNKIGPVVLIAYTNHALDHMLRSILEAKITQDIVRFGSRSSDELISKYSLFELEKLSDHGPMQQTLRREYAVMKGLEEKMENVMNDIQAPFVPWTKVKEYLDIHKPEVALNIGGELTPYWISALHSMLCAEEEDGEGEWKTAGKGGKVEGGGTPKTLYGFWRKGLDLQYITPPPSTGTNTATATFPEATLQFFARLGFEGIPPLPSEDPLHNRNVHDLEDSGNLWALFPRDRARLSKHWEQEVRRMAYLANLDDFQDLRLQYKNACQEYENIQNETRRVLLQRTKLIGCTTTGAAKLISLLTAISPKVLMVEEAGQVLEAHILSSLVPSVQHLICIGDPQQLRPTLATYRLSMDHSLGGRIYMFDRSLMERLADNGSQMSLINVQRRMRPEIANYPRQVLLILYPSLADHETVQNYPSVQGIQQNVFFFTHTHREDGEKDSVSKCNMFEVKMIRDLVIYLLKQGPYSGKGDIAVLCAYLGQLQKVRAALKDAKLTVSLDERDQEQLERLGNEEAHEVYEDVQIAKHIRLGTVDTFQGEEAKIVIVSLVRNSGDFAGDSPIGFLKVINRVNVALSRAKHGQYILGNSSNLRRNATWSILLDEMEKKGQIGPELPIVCPRHPNEVRYIKGPDEIPRCAPEGGCLAACTYQLKCGHTCQSVCHPDLEMHGRMKCSMDCPRITCPSQHPCPRECGVPCGECVVPMYDIRLLCGHVAPHVECREMENLALIKCKVKVVKQLTHCEHSAKIECSEDPAKVNCGSICGETLPCCTRNCASRCFECRQLTSPSAQTRVKRTSHRGHPCERRLYCQHSCGLQCSRDHQCNDNCQSTCLMQCAHHSCTKACSEPCPPCLEKCPWVCAHQECPVPCGSICSRLPCDEPCTNVLACQHQCPSICGEPCDEQKCIECMPANKKGLVADLIMGTTLGELDLTASTMDHRTIRLKCGHIFTVETLDGHCQMSSFYDIERDPQTDAQRYLDVKAPPIDFQTPPSCPTCRGPITARRYGRAVKRANLDILERNVASTMSKALSSATRTLGPVVEEMSMREKEARDMAFFATTKSKEEIETILVSWTAELVNSKHGESVVPIALTRPNLARGFSTKEMSAWHNLVRPLIQCFNEVAKIISKKGPHVQTYQAALATLYRLELDVILRRGDSAKPEQDAMQQVDKKMGQPPHKADTRFQVEAFFIAVEIRLLVAKIGNARHEKWDQQGGDEEKALHRKLWATFVGLLYESCIIDSTTALKVAKKSSASKQIAKCEVLVMRTEMERFRFQISLDRSELLFEGKYHGRERDILVQKIRIAKNAKELSLRLSQTKYILSRKGINLEELRIETSWFEENCGSKARKYIQEYEDLAEYIHTDRAYQPLSTEEKEAIVKAFDFGYRGHFYNCENGHTFVITECGGAMQVARCPECNATIGGNDHTLHNSNTRAMEYENIARSQGNLDAHWAWGRGA
ncbi:hypothetical protein CPB83DRAFT_755097 [Crepidotus variabilis]|uniref:NFX1-type zinc finger-containing protein 1 n=1 Tax=Crepidotus variabilis TaxID=179855 RepID=A0A9P6ER55_9AGAR|nr:hypothetical protein CPB83DRAFT_755097 [Crepidotus variabilis]